MEQSASSISNNNKQKIIRQCYKYLREQIQKKRMLENIIAIEFKLTGEMSVNLIEITDLFIYYK